MSDYDEHAELLAQVQKFRGKQYLTEGAISPQELDGQGRHIQAADAASWHVFIRGQSGRIQGCVRFRTFLPGAFAWDKLNLRSSALANCDSWRNKLASAVRSEIGEAYQNGYAYVEAGGWAVSEEARYSPDSIYVALMIFGFGRLIGGARGISTATVRNNSAGILRRLGGRSLKCGGVEIPRYYDENYGCDMEILAFDSDRPNARFAPYIDEICAHLDQVRVVCREDSRPKFGPSAAAVMSGELMPLPA